MLGLPGRILAPERRGRQVPASGGHPRSRVLWIVPILGGSVRGPRLSGRILPAGADFQVIRADGYTTLEARYVVELDDGALVYVVNTGVRHGPPEVMARITRGEPVPLEQVYFRTAPRFEIAATAHAWLTRPLFLATGIRRPDRVELAVFAVE